MNGYAVLMFIFGLLIFIYGLDVYFAKNPLIPRYYGKSISKKYKQYVGKILMVVAISPVLSGIVSYTDNFLLTISVLIVSFIFLLVLTIKIFNKE